MTCLGKLLEQGRSLPGYMAKILTDLEVVGIELAASLVQHGPPGCRLSGNHQLILWAEGHTGHPTHQVTLIKRGAAVDSSPVGSLGSNGQLIIGSSLIMLQPGPDGGLGLSTLYQGQ